MKKQNLFSSLVIVAVVLFAACSKDKVSPSQSVLNITAINGSKSEVVNVKLKSMESTDEKTFPIGCHGMLSTTFDAKNKTLGYMDCNNVYRIMDVETGVEIKQFPLPEPMVFVVVDTIRNVLIGKYFLNGTDKDNGTDHILTVKLDDGSIISDNQFYVGGTWYPTYFFRDIENEYVLLNADNNVLIFINPYTGNIIKTLQLDTEVSNGVYDRKNNRLIGMTFSNDYIVTIDLNTGKTLNKAVPQGLDFYLSEEKDYDAETDSYVLVNANKEVLFFDVETGKIKERYPLDFELTSLKLWRSAK